MDSFVRTTLLDDALLLQLQSPDNFPRLTRTVVGQLLRHIQEAADPRAHRAIVITGSDRAFAAGADLEEVSALEPVEAVRFARNGQELMDSIERCPLPVVAAIRGYCLGGGFDLAMACHLRVAASDATFGHPGGSLGIITGWGGTARLARIVGRGRARELLSTGRTISAAEAHAMRLVNRVVSPPATIETAASLARACANEPAAGSDQRFF